MSTEPLENLEELARRAVACKRWRWMPGMLSAKGLRVTRRDSDGYVVGYYEDLSYIAECVPGTLPDLTDPATLGCLLALIRKAWKDPQVHVVKLAYGFMGWQAWNADRDIAAKCGSEVEALVAALEVAP
jgi:hypothetical protein